MALRLSSAAFYCLSRFLLHQGCGDGVRRCRRAVGSLLRGAGSPQAALGSLQPGWAAHGRSGRCCGERAGTRGLRWPLPGAAAHCSCPGPGSRTGFTSRREKVRPGERLGPVACARISEQNLPFPDAFAFCLISPHADLAGAGEEKAERGFCQCM